MWTRAVTAGCVLFAAAISAQETRIERGEYLLQAAGCISCHTADEDNALPLAGGRALETPFGTFFSPNITPDRRTGIGEWTDEDFLNALWNGLSPTGKHYYPAFPYTSYTGMTKVDALAIKAYLFTREPAYQVNRENELRWYMFTRLAPGAWKLMNFESKRFAPDPDRGDDWNRGAYLVRHLGHCGECHTPRNSLAKLITERELAGNPDGPDGEKMPDITPNRETGIGRWSVDEIELFLQIGMLPDGDFVGSLMSEVIDDNTGNLTAEDRQAIAVYLKSIPASATAQNSQ
ncbi:MAG: cytochrome c [Gammaproteobacteria bacterium]|nr:cytochrome c [Gammaproteobacteria bacterium]